MGEPLRVGIIGAGLSGSLLTVNLLQLQPEIDISLIDSNPVGQGLAYSTHNPDHLLNVRAANMSAFEHDPSHFLRWLWARDSRDTNPTSIPPSGQAFVSRQLYGDYIASVFQDTVARFSGRSLVSLVPQKAVDLIEGECQIVTLTDGRKLYFDKLVLCLGNFLPATPMGMTDAAAKSPRYISNPWSQAALRGIPENDSVLIVGSGLTMVDVIQSLRRQGHRGPIRVVSRHGLVPLPHLPTQPSKVAFATPPPTHSLLALFGWLRSEMAAHASLNWRSVLDALRPQTTVIWQALPHTERKRFLRHLRSYWEVHRHRLPLQITAQLDALKQSQQLMIKAGRIETIEASDENLVVDVRWRSQRDVEHIKVPWLINCSGSQSDYENLPDPLVHKLLERGVVRADALRLGLDVANTHLVIGRKGAVSKDIFALGPPTKGAFFESTAVPDIRSASALVARLLADIGGGISNAPTVQRRDISQTSHRIST